MSNAKANNVFAALVQVAQNPVAKEVKVTKARNISASKPKVIKVEQALAFEYNVRGHGAARLFAYTAAWLELTGLIHGGQYPVNVVKALGGSAFSYHKKQGNFAELNGMAYLTPKGIQKFQDRANGVGSQSFDMHDMDNYMLMMQTGLNDDFLVKSEAVIKKIEA